MSLLIKGLRIKNTTYRDIKEATEFLPRYNCAKYFYSQKKDNGLTFLIKREDFEELRINAPFNEGPYVETFCENVSNREKDYKQAYGRLNNNTLIYCELNEENNKKISSIFDSNSIGLDILDLN